MNKIALFYHVYQFGEWKELVAEQIERVRVSGLLEVVDYIHIGVNGGNEIIPIQFNKSHTIKYNPQENWNAGEMDTLIDLHKFCRNNLDYKILFFHTKGISWFEQNELYSNIILWRKYLERLNIDNWKKCCDLLETHDCVGTEWETDMVLGGKSFVAPCYAGTFWWANAIYINKLDPNYLLLDNWGPGTKRWQSEFWIGTGNPKHYNFFSSGKNKYYNAINPDEYNKFIIEE